MTTATPPIVSYIMVRCLVCGAIVAEVWSNATVQRVKARCGDRRCRQLNDRDLTSTDVPVIN